MQRLPSGMGKGLSTDQYEGMDKRDTPASVFVPGTPMSTTVSVDYLGVGGGGSGAYGGGGGGGGEVLSGTDTLVVGSYAVVIGAGGGPGKLAIPSRDGSDSTWNGHTARAGDGGAVSYASPSNTGASGSGNAAGANNGTSLGGGGGGDGAPGSPASSLAGGNGGAGTASSISGAEQIYGSGGGGGGDHAGLAGGNGGTNAGNGSQTGSGSAATANFGGGGGGGMAWSGGTSADGGAGGSGIWIMSYVTGTCTATGGTITTSGSRTIHTFTSSDNFQITSIA